MLIDFLIALFTTIALILCAVVVILIAIMVIYVVGTFLEDTVKKLIDKLS